MRSLALAVLALLTACVSTSEPRPMQIHYLEIVTPDVDQLCTTYAAANGLTFGDAVPELGNARTAKLPNGGTVGVRAPMRATEDPVVRPYFLVEDIEAAVASAAANGAEIAMGPTPMPSGELFAVYLQAGVQQGFWQR